MGGLTMVDYNKRDAAIAYIREQSEECQKAFEELGGESGIYADAYNDLAEDFYSIPTVDAVVVTRCKDCRFNIERSDGSFGCYRQFMDYHRPNDFCSYGEPKEG